MRIIFLLFRHFKFFFNKKKKLHNLIFFPSIFVKRFHKYGLFIFFSFYYFHSLFINAGMVSLIWNLVFASFVQKIYFFKLHLLVTETFLNMENRNKELKWKKKKDWKDSPKWKILVQLSVKKKVLSQFEKKNVFVPKTIFIL